MPFAPVSSSPAPALPCPVAFFRLDVTVLVPFHLLHSGVISAFTNVLHHLHPFSPWIVHSGCSKLRHSAQRAPGCSSPFHFTKLQHFLLFPFLKTNALPMVFFCLFVCLLLLKQLCFPCLTPAFCCRVAPAPALLVPVELLHELGDGAEVGVAHLLHQHDVVAVQDLRGQERWQWLGVLGW